MALITLRERTSPGQITKNALLTNFEIDTNFININSELVGKLNASGGSLTGKLTFAESTTSRAQANLSPMGAAPIVPVVGDVWSTSAGIYFRDITSVTRRLHFSDEPIATATFAQTANSVAEGLIPGDYIIGDVFVGSVEKTWSINASSSNIPYTIVARDDDGNFIASDVTVTNLNSSSDRNLKDNITKIQNALAVVSTLNGVEYDWKDTTKHAAGLIAQDVELQLPHAVSTSGNFKTVAYNQIIPYLVEAIKDLHSEIENLKRNK